MLTKIKIWWKTLFLSILDTIKNFIIFRGLSGTDVLSKSDPMCVTYVQPFGQKNWVEFHRTETVKNNQDPNFVSKVLISYRFEEKQPLLFEVYDTDSKDKDLSAHDFLGTITIPLGQLVANKRVRKSILHYR